MASLSSSTSLLQTWPNIYQPKDYRDGLFHVWKHGFQGGISTGFANLDKYITIVPGWLYVVTGTPNVGKSEFVDQIVYNLIDTQGWKFGLYSPENKPYDYHLIKLVERHIGDAIRLESGGDVTLASEHSIQQAIEHYQKHIYWVDKVITLDDILEAFHVLASDGGCRGFVLDPFNRVETQRPPHEAEPKWITKCLQRMQDFARMYKVVFFLVAHPRKLEREKNGLYPIVKPYDISGSSGFNDVSDCVLSLYRELPNTNVDVHIQKVREKRYGIQGVAEFDYSRRSGRYRPLGEAEVPF